MTIGLNLADVLFLQAQVIFGSTPPPGTDPFSLLGLRAVDGSFNNLTNTIVVDQYGNIVQTNTFALVDQPFFNIGNNSSPNSYDPSVSYTNFESLRGGTGATTGDDTIVGTTGNDFISGGLGNDTLTGNGGINTFVFDTTPSPTNIDTITDFQVGIDKISLESSIFNQLSGGTTLLGSEFEISSLGATSASTRIVYDSATGALFYDADGTAGASPVQFATLATGLALTASDFVVASRAADTSPRVISNLVADMSANNPAYTLVEASARPATGNPGAPAFDVPPTNSLFTFFGQFFDHGLDFIDKGGSGTIEIALLPGDPLYGLAPLNSMFVDRATLVDGQNNNGTAPLVEQSQTYGQKASTTFYLMEYDPITGNPTGRLVTHSDGTMATWADIKANAAIKGIILTDADVLNVPEPIFNAGTGFWDKGPGTGQAFIADIAHAANPAGGKVADDDIGNLDPNGFGLVNSTGTTGFFDNELLDAHKVAGDGRVNENIALTSIHEAFHSEHNRIVELIKDLILQQDQVTPGFITQWQIAPGVWDGEKLFLSAKVVNENQYQHMVFEEFARRLSPNIDAFAQYDVTINPNISAEFSQAVYRLGHSMLTDNVRMEDAAGNVSDMTLVNAFLNPLAFDAVGAASIIQGTTQVEMNEIDEFVVDALRNMLLGLPLDLAAINIARGRDVGLPTLNALREQLYADTGGEGTLAPYTSWADFGAHLLHPESLVNFIAAYARDADIAAARDVGDNALARSLAQYALTNGNFQNTANLLANDQGFWDIDLWIGGLAENKAGGPLGAPPSMLGTTFDFIFAMQLRALQDGDRLYYLARLGGTNILTEIESMKFGDLYERGTGARHTNGDIFSVADQYVELSTLGVVAFSSAAGVWMEVIGGTTKADTIHAGAGNDTVWGEDGNDEIWGDQGNDVLYGNAGNDKIHGGDGLDFIRGDGGNDEIWGDGGDDVIFGKTGDDILHGGAGFDVIEGGLGNDWIDGGDQDDTLVGQENDDIMFGGLGNDNLDAGTGNDFLSGGRGNDILLGFEGDDVLDGGAGADVLDGGGLALVNPGHDVASYQSSIVGLTIDMGVPANSTGDAIGDTYVGIEEILGTTKNDIIIGDIGDNFLNGGGAAGTVADALLGDRIDGGAGNDVLYGNYEFKDTLIGGIGTDQVVYLGHNSTDFSNWQNISTLGDGTVTQLFGLGVSDTLTGIEELVFDDGIWSTTRREWIPLVGVSNTTPLTVNGVLIDGTFVSNLTLDDNFNIPQNGIKVGNIEVFDPDGVNGTRTITLAGVDAASFRVNNTPAGPELYFVGGRATGFAKVNFEAKDRYEITVTVTDSSGTSSIDYEINVRDKNDNAPLFTSPDRIIFSQGGDPTVVVYRATATDRDTVTNINAANPGGTALVNSVVGDALRFSLAAAGGGNNNDLFTMSDNGEVRVGGTAGIPGPGTYVVEVVASDGIQSSTQTVTVTITGSLLANGIFTTGDDTVDLNTFDLSLYTQLAATDALAGNDTVTLSDTQNTGVLFDGNLGNDRIISSVADDIIDGGSGTDTVVLSGHAYGFAVTSFNDEGSIVVTDTNLGDGDSGADQLSGIEFLDNALGGQWEVQLGDGNANVITSQLNSWDIINGGGGADTITGGTGDDWLGGASGADTIAGGAGNDHIYGGADADTIDGGANNDFIDGGTGNDIIDGGSGTDTVVLSGHAYGFAVTSFNDDGSIVVTDTNLGDGDSGADQLSGIEFLDNALGGQWEVQLGDGNANVITSQLNSWDIINGGGGADTITGGTGDDWLGGASGNDIINGGLGKDVLSGGADQDTFVFDSVLSASNVDRVTDFEVGQDTVSLSASIFTALSVGSLSTAEFTNLFSGVVDSNTRVIYDNISGVLSYDADGAGGVAAQEFAQLQAGLDALSETDFIIAA
ncbi:MAG: peroxidase family protein [Hyphomicrobium sp.]